MNRSYLLENLLIFGRILHGLGLDVTPARMIDIVQTFEHVNIGLKTDFYYTLRTLCVNSREDLPLFDQAFQMFWQKPQNEPIELTLGELIGGDNQPQEPIQVPPNNLEENEHSLDESDIEDDEDVQEIIEVTQTFSARERLAQKDFGDLTHEEINQVKRLMAQLVWNLGQRKTRRKEIGKSEILDLRRSIRRSFRTEGEMLHWSTQTLKIKPRPLVVIADISGSMEQYTKMLIHFLYSLAGGLNQRVEVFVFSTRLTRITRQLRYKNVDRAILEVSQTVPDWSGGTRIGEAIKQFNFDWARRVLRGGAVTLLISDGWDRGDPDLLAKEMARLGRTTHRLIWLNPLLSSERFEPLTRGLVAALPHCDDFLPVHNLASLEDLAEHLALLDGKSSVNKKNLKGSAFIGR